MADASPIEWTEATWNPIAGCSLVSPGCTNCYAMRRVAPRLSANPTTPHYAGTVQSSKAGPVWTGKIGIASDAVFTRPLTWRQPRMIFVNSTSDLFHPGVPDEVIDRVFAIAALCPHHILQILTKRPERMRDYLTDPRTPGRIARQILDLWIAGDKRVRAAMAQDHWPVRSIGEIDDPDDVTIDLPLPNVWLGVSAEDQTRVDERIPLLLDTPAAIRWISVEPLLGPISFRWAAWHDYVTQMEERRSSGATTLANDHDGLRRLDWIVVGGESGHDARWMANEWAEAIVAQCRAAGVPVFVKQLSGPNGRAVKDIVRFPTSLQIREWPRLNDFGRNRDEKDCQQ